MKTTVKVLIALAVGLIVCWLCYQVFHLEQLPTTFVSILTTSVTWAIFDKAPKRE